MNFLLFLYLNILLSTVTLIETTRVNKYLHQEHEVYKVEHEISTTQAKNHALTMDLNDIIEPAGCQPCTKSELSYCTSSSIINDHCCCEKRFEESFPFIPHTCFVGNKLCKPMFSCDDYIRLKRCCCHKLLLAKWKEMSSSSSIISYSSFYVLNVILLYIVNRYLY
nr:uncharacterized protein LOC111422867 [Onthophagus taurus]XP_022911892.1 uncharacterized protein LOC111422867 [Onthophagus taurus]